MWDDTTDRAKEIGRWLDAPMNLDELYGAPKCKRPPPPPLPPPGPESRWVCELCGPLAADRKHKSWSCRLALWMRGERNGT